MSYLILSIIVISVSYSYDRLRNTEKISKGVKWLFYIAICFSLCLFAGLRTKYNDTGTYIKLFSETPKKFSNLFSSKISLSEVYLFEFWNYCIYHFISQNANVYLFLSSIVFVCPAIYLMGKYSKNFTFSVMLFMFAGMYLFSLAGLKQAMATGMVMMAFPSLIKKQYFKYYLFCIFAVGFHSYSILFLVVPLLGEEPFNKRTVFFCLIAIFIGALMSYFSSVISAVIKLLGKEVSEDTIQSGSVNILRVVVFLVPFVLSICARKKLSALRVEDKVFIKIGMLSSVFMVLALFGNPILFGRIPQYFLIGIVVSIPLLIDKAFVAGEQKRVISIAAFCYIIYGLYGLYTDGAFTRDIFQLIWF